MSNGTVRLSEPGIEYRSARSVGVGGVTEADLTAAAPAAQAAAEGFKALLESGESQGMDEPVWWPRLGEDAGNGDLALASAKAWGSAAQSDDVVVSVGIGGSYLGNRVLRDALLGTAWNDLPRAARGAPALKFAGYHLDPAEVRQLVSVLDAEAAAQGTLRVRLLSISKSGTTTETLATTLALLEALGRVDGVTVDFAALTAEGSVLADMTRTMGGTLLPFPEGMGGRWSVLSSVGLATAAATGVDVDALLQGARTVRSALLEAGGDLNANPALRYAVIHHLHGQRGRTGAVFMPYSERLRCVSEWYVQLLAESLGKATNRAGETVHTGRTPIVAVGTTDMHAQTQLHQEGRLDKTVTTLDVLDWGPVGVDRVPKDERAGKLAGKTFAALNTLAREANEEALAGSDRPSDSFVLDRIDAASIGGLLYLLMATVAYEGELLGVCAYDQPGVEAYKTIMKARL